MVSSLYSSIIFLLTLCSSAVECMKELLIRCQYDKLRTCIEAENGWKQFEDEKTYPDGITTIARYSTAFIYQGRLKGKLIAF